MERLVVMDFSDSSISVYTNPEDKDTETLLKELGHDIDECSVMFCESVTINLNNESIKDLFKNLWTLQGAGK